MTPDQPERPPIDPSRIYHLDPAIAIEDFGDRSLVFHCTDLRLVELNPVARDLLSRLDGQSTLRQIATSMAEDYDQPLQVVLEDVQDTAAQMLQAGLIRAPIDTV